MEKSSDRFSIKNFLFKKKLGIREQVQRIIFICSVVSFFTVGVIALAGMFTARHNSIEDGSQMGERAAEIAADKLEYVERRRISLFAVNEDGLPVDPTGQSFQKFRNAFGVDFYNFCFFGNHFYCPFFMRSVKTTIETFCCKFFLC